WSWSWTPGATTAGRAAPPASPRRGSCRRRRSRSTPRPWGWAGNERPVERTTGDRPVERTKGDRPAERTASERPEPAPRLRTGLPRARARRRQSTDAAGWTATQGGCHGTGAGQEKPVRSLGCPRRGGGDRRLGGGPDDGRLLLVHDELGAHRRARGAHRRVRGREPRRQDQVHDRRLRLVLHEAPDRLRRGQRPRRLRAEL